MNRNTETEALYRKIETLHEREQKLLLQVQILREETDALRNEKHTLKYMLDAVTEKAVRGES